MTILFIATFRARITCREIIKHLSRAGHVVTEVYDDFPLVEEQIIRFDPQFLLLANNETPAKSNGALTGLRKEFPRLTMHHIRLVQDTDRPRTDWLCNALRFKLAQEPRLPRRPPVPAETPLYHLDSGLPPSAFRRVIDRRLSGKNRPKQFQADRKKFLSLLTMAEVNHLHALAYWNLARQSREQLSLRCARGILGSHPLGMASARLDLCRSLSVLAHYVQGVELTYLPSAVDPSGHRIYIHHAPTPAMQYALYAAVENIDPWLRQSLLETLDIVWPESPSMEDAFRLNTQFSGLAAFLQSVVSLHLRLMSDWLNNARKSHSKSSPRTQELDLFAHYWDLPSLREKPELLAAILKEFHSGVRYTSPLSFPPFGYFSERAKKQGLPGSSRK